jgi:hypothetical protein
MLRQQGIHDWPIGWADYTTVCRLITFQFFNVIVYLVRLQQKTRRKRVTLCALFWGWEDHRQQTDDKATAYIIPI